MTILAIRFLAELLGWAAAGYAAAMAVGDGPGRPIVGVAATLAFVVVWSRTVAPRAQNRLSQRSRDALATLLLLIVAVGIWLVGQRMAATAFAVVLLVDYGLMLAVDPRPALHARPVGRQAWAQGQDA